MKLMNNPKINNEKENDHNHYYLKNIKDNWENVLLNTLNIFSDKENYNSEESEEESYDEINNISNENKDRIFNNINFKDNIIKFFFRLIQNP